MADDTPKHQPDQPENRKASTPGDPMATPDVELAIEQADALLEDAARQIGLGGGVQGKSAGRGGSGTDGHNPSGNVGAVEQELDALEAMLNGALPSDDAPPEAEEAESAPGEGVEAVEAFDGGEAAVLDESAESETPGASKGSTGALESDQMLDALEAAINGPESVVPEEASGHDEAVEPGSTGDAAESEAGTAEGDALLSALEAAILGDPSTAETDDLANRDEDRNDPSETLGSEFDDDGGQVAGLSEEGLAELDEMIASSVEAEPDAPADSRPGPLPVSDDPSDAVADEAPDEATDVVEDGKAGEVTDGVPDVVVAAPAPAPATAVIAAPSREVGALTRALWLPAAGLVGVCDAIDRVVGRLADPFVKQIIGYVAIGTLALAAMLLGWAWLKP